MKKGRKESRKKNVYRERQKVKTAESKKTASYTETSEQFIESGGEL